MAAFGSILPAGALPDPELEPAPSRPFVNAPLYPDGTIDPFQDWISRAAKAAWHGITLPGRTAAGTAKPLTQEMLESDWRNYSDTPPEAIPGTEKIEPGLADAVGFGSILPRSKVATMPSIEQASDLAGVMLGGGVVSGPARKAGEAVVGSGPQRIAFNDPVHKQIAMREAERGGGGTQTMYPSEAAIDRARGVTAPAAGSWDELVAQTMARWNVDKMEGRAMSNDARVLAQSRTGETLDDMARDFTLGSGGTDKKSGAIAAGAEALKSGGAPQYVYHATDPANLASIEKKGLVPKGDGVFFAPNEKMRDAWGNEGNVLFRADRNALPELRKEFSGDPDASGSLYHPSKVPPEKLEVSQDGGKTWRPIGQPTESVQAFDFGNPGGGTREARIGNTDITYGVGNDGVEVTLVRTPKEHRGEGSARAAMQKMVEEADAAGVRLQLNADPMDKGVSKGGLVDFYKSLGFTRNAGNKRDFSTRAEYIREPIAAPVQEAPKAAGLPMDQASRMQRAGDLGYEGPWYHGGDRMDRFTESGKINPKRATSGPMPYFTDNPEMASSYATGKKADTSLQKTDTGNVADYFQVSPKDMFPGTKARAPYSVEQSWHFLPQEKKAEIMDKAARIGHADRDTGGGGYALHPPGEHGGPSSAGHWEQMLKENRGNPLAALRDLWLNGGIIHGAEHELADIYKMAGYPHPISQTNAPWTEARGVFPGMLKMKNPLKSDDVSTLRDTVIPALEEAFKRDRTRKPAYSDTDMWDKNSAYTPREWVAALKEDVAAGKNSFTFSSIPDKVTAELRKLGFDGILDTGGKMGGPGHRVAIPFDPHQVRSRFAKFDPKNEGKSMLLGSGATDEGTAAAVTGGNAALRAETPAIRAYHGSPHDFDRFDISKIGTGEGAQAYGHGLYFAENPATAQSYRDSLSDLKPRKIEGTDLELPSWVAKTIQSGNPVAIENMRTDFRGRLAEMRRELADPNTLQPWNIEANIPGIEKILKALDQFEGGAKIAPAGRMYEVDIKAHPNSFLDWDKPLKDQSQHVGNLPALLEAARREAHDRAISAGTQSRRDELFGMVKNPQDAPGGFALQALAPRQPGGHRMADASNMLRDAGIPGIKYLDQGSRPLSFDPRRMADLEAAANKHRALGDTAKAAEFEKILAGYPKPSSNFVVFDDKLIDILRKYGIVAAPAGFGSLMPAGADKGT